MDSVPNASIPRIVHKRASLSECTQIPHLKYRLSKHWS
jgi:hypothetical protein